MPIPGTVQVTGSIAPTNVSDTYPSHDAIYGKGGQRSVADFATRNAISTARRVEGMLVYTESDGKTWVLLPAPWTNTDTDWAEFSGGGGDPGTTGILLVATNIIDSLLATACEGGDWQILLENGTLRYKTTLSVAHNGTTANAAESASVPGPGVGVLPVTFDADISGGQLRILATASAVGWSYRARRLTLLVI
jgi:hypothetical protein